MTKKGFCASIAALLAGAGLSLAGEPAATDAAVEWHPAHVAVAPCVKDDGNCEAARLWARSEALVWWLKSAPETAPLASTGVLGRGAAVLFGGNNINTDAYTGGRLTVGAMLPNSDTVGGEFSSFFVTAQNTNLGFTPPAGAVFPFIQPGVGPSAIGFSTRDVATTRETLTLRQYLQGSEADGLLRLSDCGTLRVDVLGGMRYLDHHENLGFRVDVNGTPGGIVPDFVGTFADQFNARNQFVGASTGIRAEADLGNWFVSATAKIALGNVHQHLDILGGSSEANGAAAGFFTGNFPGHGIFAQPTNRGTFTRDRFAAVPEATVNVGYNVTDWARAFVGYNFLYISNVVRPGDQLSSTINSSNVPALGNPVGPLVGPIAPLPIGKQTDFWAQGLTFGLTFEF